MSETLDRLQEEHRNAARVLAALERQIAAFDEARRPDYDIVLAIADYFTGFPERCHHPKEDLIYRKLLERAPQHAELTVDLGNEHEKLMQRARYFKEVVCSVLMEAEIPRDTFAEAARRFIAEQRQHMSMEEEHFFPASLEALTAEDWAEIDSRVLDEADPLFNSADAETFAILRENILQWELEARENG